MKRFLLPVMALFLTAGLSAQMVPEETEWYSPIPPKLTPGSQPGMPPSDAVILFDGKDLSKWKSEDDSAPKWEIHPTSDIRYMKRMADSRSCCRITGRKWLSETSGSEICEDLGMMNRRTVC